MHQNNIARAERIARIIDGYPDRPADPAEAVAEGIAEEEINDTITDCLHLTEYQDANNAANLREVRIVLDGWDFTIPKGVAATLRMALNNYVAERSDPEGE